MVIIVRMWIISPSLQDSISDHAKGMLPFPIHLLSISHHLAPQHPWQLHEKENVAMLPGDLLLEPSSPDPGDENVAPEQQRDVAALDVSFGSKGQ